MPNDLLTGPKSSAITWYFRIISMAYIVLPFVTLIFWGALVYTEGASNADKTSSKEAVHEHKVGGASIIILGFSFLLAALAIFKIRWNNWRFKRTHAIVGLVSLILLTIW